MPIDGHAAVNGLWKRQLDDRHTRSAAKIPNHYPLSTIYFLPVIAERSNTKEYLF